MLSQASCRDQAAEPRATERGDLGGAERAGIDTKIVDLNPSNSGSTANCERPIQLLVVLPRSDGRRVIAVFVPATALSMYSVPV